MITTDYVRQSTIQNFIKPAILNICNEEMAFGKMPSPLELRTEIPLSSFAAKTVANAESVLKNILDNNETRLMVVVGPCSIHDIHAGLDYANRLKKLADKLSDKLFIVMRAYFEKPRTSIGWKGFINDPLLDGSCRIALGIKKARQFLLEVNELGLPVATELLDPQAVPYLNDLVSWVAIGARTTESQIHREIASSLNSPVGFKNSTDGSFNSAANAILSASKPHSFIGPNNEGYVSIIRTQGNKYGHLVLRGGNNMPNYDEASIQKAEKLLEQMNLPKNIMVDCSHGNSSKNYKLQEVVLQNVVQQLVNGNCSIKGAMIESNIEAGNQALTTNVSDLKYGCSITDACVDWETTERMLYSTYDQLSAIKPK